MVPVVCRTPEAGRPLAAALQRSGIDAPVSVLKGSTAVPDGDVYILLDGPGVPVARQFRESVGRSPAMRKAIAYAESVPARDIAALEQLGIRYYCNANNGLGHLFKLIGQIKADVLLGARARAAEAEAVAMSVFQATTSALDLFSGQTSFDHKFYTDLTSTYVDKIQGTSLFLLVDTISQNHDTTIQHCSLVTTLATAFASSLGFPHGEMERVFLAAFFHDIGKSAIPKAVIDKPGKLTDDEMRLMRTHVTVGHEMLRRFPETAGEIADVALLHHEYLDGSGYPHGLRGGEIPDLIRIVTIADIYAALIERRAYKPPFSPEKAFSILREMGGKLDQDLVGLFQPVAESIDVKT
ncbi:HD-GYP domain-containing protein [Oharaeibacter diazotrophicus]|uniref:Putative nucleotidyltransferase with HDIG domain n=1 Tax=Oharaeibacter diazotrophicus TaxID=1920512 RepID=A0A4R6RJQ9_9HYPH|nr:HD-GYP domain-containing protein [Oharaeibacter diazotrophicus]TDP86773.1 putative nucleotidyltransferase with HDIG domain [Oharaeibacter diazotrophicus]BBE71284.1 cyclic di-GMP phosphodiesterase response regulator RpfG [Pleomorphomonas sp. SM30]GLS78039.1 hypothetical protein GCM10007904_33760 [Oharaeibacter diazotrophicus]